MATDTYKGQALKYAMVGLVNTGVTALVIFAMINANIDIYISNASGYVVGIIFSFFANSIFTFSSSLSVIRFAKFLIASVVCWLVNIFFIKIFLMIYPSNIYSSQIIGMCVYTATGFLINKLWVMK